ncbi:hypothetical protein CALCODRAFT_372556 [Calocera cornea HHB12733]|uniref:Uncharacterized protein n=1 Tax=Calocera cornea HHB12733 TaxID=1353952 RepID=A0A165EGX8_9BASI|nr:hypothetical protein CALCODRAFT_372556 [Calocera cornea HHB12733]
MSDGNSIDLEDATMRINTLATDLSLMEHLLGSLMSLCGRLLSMMPSYKNPETAVRQPWQLPSPLSASLRNDIRFMQGRNEALINQVRQLQRKTQIQLAVVNTFISQRDNKLNLSVAADSRALAVSAKTDSTAMKSIAVLTMFFLPSTFLASLFAMPVFNWSAGPEESVIDSRAWIYLAIAVPLTAAALGLWWLWSWYIGYRDSRVDRVESMRKFAQINTTPAVRPALLSPGLTSVFGSRRWFSSPSPMRRSFSLPGSPISPQPPNSRPWRRFFAQRRGGVTTDSTLQTIAEVLEQPEALESPGRPSPQQVEEKVSQIQETRPAAAVFSGSIGGGNSAPDPRLGVPPIYQNRPAASVFSDYMRGL